MGVLQGSFLAALLFLIYVNDFYKCIDALSIVYADDTSCLFKHKDMHILKNLLEKNLKSIFNCYCLNKLCLNVDRTKFMFFSLNDQKIENFPTL